MKVRDLVAALQKADPNLDVCLFADDDVQAVNDVGVWSGAYHRPMGAKMALERVQGTYVGLGNPGDFDTLASDTVCHSIQVLTDSVTTNTVKFQVEINGGPTQVIEVKTGIYELAAMTALATLDYAKRDDPDDDSDVVKIWVEKLLPDYGPSFFSYSAGGRGIAHMIGNDPRKW